MRNKYLRITLTVLLIICTCFGTLTANADKEKTKSFEMINNHFENGANSLEIYQGSIAPSVPAGRYGKYSGKNVDVYYCSRLDYTSAVDSSGLRIPNGWEIREFQDLLIDFANNGTTNGIELNSGKIIKISFDFALTSDFSSGSFARTSFNMPLNDSIGGSVFDFQRKDGKACFGFDKNTGVSGFIPENRDYVTSIEDNVIHNLEMYIDMRNYGCIYYYLDGERMLSSNEPSIRTDKQIVDATSAFSLRTFSFHLCDIISYFNNLTVSSIESDSFMALECENAYEGDCDITVCFNEIPSESNSDFVVYKNGNVNIPFTDAEVLPGNKLKITLEEPIEKGANYLIRFSEGFKNAFGNQINPNENELEFQAYDFAKYVSDGQTLNIGIDADGILPTGGVNESVCAKKIPTETNKIVLDFTGGISGSLIKNNISIRENGNTFTDYTVSSDVNKVIIDLNDFPKCKSNYEIFISAGGVLKNDCVLRLSTDEGKVIYKEVEYYKGQDKINAFSELAKGDTLTVKMLFIKTVPEEKTFMASAALFDDYEMKDFDFAIVDMKTDEKEKSAEFEFVIDEFVSPYLKTYIWKDLSEIYPIGKNKKLK